MEEIWKDVVGYEGLYQVSDLGNVRSLPRVSRGRIYKGKNLKYNNKSLLNKNNYAHITLCKEGAGNKHISIHRLVAITFLDKPYGKDVVNHINGCKGDNRAKNLEWCTQNDNINHVNNPKRPPKNRNIVFDLNIGVFYDSIYDAAFSRNINYNTLMGMLIKHYSYKNLTKL